MNDITPTTTDPAPQNPPTAPSDPSLLAGKYRTPDDLSKGINEARQRLGLDPIDGNLFGKDGFYAGLPAAERGYLDLQKQLSRGPSPTTPPPARETGEPMRVDPTPKPPANAPQGLDARTILKAGGLDNDSVVRQFTEHGNLTETQYEAIREGFRKTYGVQAKLPANLIDDYIRQQQQLAQLQTTVSQSQVERMVGEAAQIVGGEDKLDALLKNARGFVPEDEIDGINEMLANPKTYKIALRDLQRRQAEYVGAGGAQPIVQDGAAPPATSAGLTQNATYADFQAVMKAAQRGDAAARARLAATPTDVLSKFT